MNKTAGQTRIDNLERLLSEHGITLEALAAQAESTPQYLSQVRNRTPDAKTGRPRQMGDAMARRIEVAFGKPAGWMDRDHDEAAIGDLEPNEADLLRSYRALQDDALRLKLRAFAAGLAAASAHQEAKPAMFSRKRPTRAA